MKTDEARKIIENERLILYSFFESRDDGSDEIVMKSLNAVLIKIIDKNCEEI